MEYKLEPEHENTRFIWTQDPYWYRLSELMSMPLGNALEITGGTINDASWLADRGWAVEVVDVFKERQTSHCENHFDLETSAPNFFQTIALADFRPGANTLDLVILNYCSIPIDYLQLLLERLAIALKSSGKVFFIAPSLQDHIESREYISRKIAFNQIQCALQRYLKIDYVCRIEVHVDGRAAPLSVTDYLIRASSLNRYFPGE